MLAILLVAALFPAAALMAMPTARRVILEDPFWDYRLYTGYLVLILGLGVTTFSRKELRPADAWLYALPIARSRIVLVKLANAALIAALPGPLVLAISVFLGLDARLAMATMVMAVPLLVAVVTMSVHFQQGIIASAAALFSLSPIVAGWMFWILSMGRETQAVDPLWVEAAIKGVILGLLIAGWLFFLLGRTRILELGRFSQVMLGLVFAYVLYYVATAIFLADWGDLVLLLFGGL